MRGILTVISLFWVMIQSSYSSQINPAEVLNLTLADHGMTRISVEDHKITDIFVYPADSTQSFRLHSSGHVFIVPNASKQDIFLSIVFAKGEVQDLKLSFMPQEVKPLILKKGDKNKYHGRGRGYRKKVESSMDVLLKGKIPKGFSKISTKNAERKFEYGIVHHMQSYIKGDHVLSLWKIQSNHSEPIMLKADMFLTQDERGEVLESHLPAKGETFLVISLQKKNIIQGEKA